LDDPDRLARAALSLLGTLGTGDDEDQTVVAVMDHAAAMIRAADPSPTRQALLAELLARLGAYLATHRPHRSTMLADEALEIARQAGDARVLAIALLYSTRTAALGRDEHEARLRDAARLAQEGGDLEVVLAAYTSLMVAALLWADREQFDRCLAEYARVAASMGAVTPLLLSAVDHAGAAALDGRYAEADEQFRAARRRSASLGDPSLPANIGAGLTPVDRELGRLARRVQAARQLAAATQAPRYEAHLVRVLSETGEHGEATERLHALLARSDELLSGFLRPTSLAFLAEATAVLGDTDAAASLYKWLEAEARHGECVNVGAHVYHGALRRYLGLLALTLNLAEEAVSHHEAALAVHERMRARGWIARSRYDLARALIARGAEGDVDRASRLVEEAITTAHELGMPKLLEELLALHAADGSSTESR
jgi:tetratricopeptide (TPR) repeat protein